MVEYYLNDKKAIIYLSGSGTRATTLRAHAVWPSPWTHNVFRCHMWYKFALLLLILEVGLEHFESAAMASTTSASASSMLPPDHVEHNVKACYNSLN
eukprot:11560277-Heterocapsa_arctica.AAC.1